MKDSEPGTLIVASAPIGQPEDASPRLASALAEAAVIAVEDIGRLRRLAGALGVKPAGRFVSYSNGVEQARVPGLLAALESGDDVLLVTAAGMPGVSDPGYRLVAAAAAAGLRVTVLPGPSAVTAALAVSGLPSDRFCFEGFPPRGEGKRARRFAELADEPRTLVFFEAARRAATTLAELAAAFGPDRRAVICRELSKTHEEIRRGTLGELAEWAAVGLLGEVTLVVAGSPVRAGARHAAVAGRPGQAVQPAGLRQPAQVRQPVQVRHPAHAGRPAHVGHAGQPGHLAPAAEPGPSVGPEQATQTGRALQTGRGLQTGRALTPAEATAAAEVAAREAAGTPRKEAIAAVAKETGLRKREVYDAVVVARRR
jgi:16S rRNA (cytidine1402-2'-O)-methyltransferase